MPCCLRSPIAHGRLRRVDIEQARNMPGVLDVITADELAEAGIGAHCPALQTSRPTKPGPHSRRRARS